MYRKRLLGEVVESLSVEVFKDCGTKGCGGDDGNGLTVRLGDLRGLFQP